MSPVYNIFSKRKKLERGEYPDVYQYTDFENVLRVKIVHIISDAFGVDVYNSPATKAYEFVKDVLCREYGVFELIPHYMRRDHREHVLDYFLQEKNIERALDVVEICFRLINGHMRSYEYTSGTRRKIDPDDAINELNARFKEHGFGFQFESGTIIKVDSEYIHSEIVKKALSLLSRNEFEGANQEFLQAHEHYRAGRNKECLNECLKAFESTIKIICSIKKIKVESTATAKKLIDILFETEIIPSYLKSEYTAFQSTLESGVPTIRNKLSGHGQGEDIRTVEDVFAEYMLNLTASNIVFLVKCILPSK